MYFGRLVVSIGLLILAADGVAAHRAPDVACRPSPTPSSPTTSGTRAAAAQPTQSVNCGSTTVTIAAGMTPALAASAAQSSASAQKPASKVLSSSAQVVLLQYGLGAAGVLGVLALCLVAWALLVGLQPRGGFAVNRDTIQFGGAGRGWEISPALVILFVAFAVGGLAVTLAVQVVERTRDGLSDSSISNSKKPS